MRYAILGLKHLKGKTCSANKEDLEKNIKYFLQLKPHHIVGTPIYLAHVISKHKHNN
jgi:phenylacetate-coenzyme A ligase PaaK-like adenylate-forming protein